MQLVLCGEAESGYSLNYYGSVYLFNSPRYSWKYRQLPQEQKYELCACEERTVAPPSKARKAEVRKHQQENIIQCISKQPFGSPPEIKRAFNFHGFGYHKRSRCIRVF